jgi:DNA-cytosine methyltransferase
MTKNVFAPFDGHSGGQIALKQLGIKFDNYFASEIDKYAIEVTQHNFRKTIQLGDIRKIKGKDLPPIWLMLGGTPCQGLSKAGKGLDFDDPRSKLFYEFVRLYREIKPKYFLLENVQMKKECQDIISKALGVEPVMIDSALVSAQRRKRMYWTNIPFLGQPKDQKIMLADVVDDVVDEKYHVHHDRTLNILNEEVRKGKIGYFGTDSQANRVYDVHGKSVTLTSAMGGNGSRTGYYCFGVVNHTFLKMTESKRRFNEGDKSFALTVAQRAAILKDGGIRTLTPTECKRLQTIPDWFKMDMVSESQQYKMIGNGWTSKVIQHLLKPLKNENVMPLVTKKAKGLGAIAPALYAEAERLNIKFYNHLFKILKK